MNKNTLGLRGPTSQLLHLPFFIQSFFLQNIVLQIMHYAIWLVFHRNYTLVKTAQSYFVSLTHDQVLYKYCVLHFSICPLDFSFYEIRIY